MLPSERSPVITLLTDFGHADYFVAAMKGVIVSINPKVRIIDIAHEIPPQDVEAAAFNLLACYRSFPKGTIHVAVVDPGVGSSRAQIVIEAGEQIFVGPDNGIFSYVCDREREYKVFQITNRDFFCKPVSNTFHGRDVFAPIAAAISTGIPIDRIGKLKTDFVRLASLSAERDVNGNVRGRIIHVDHFGNCITNLTKNDFSEDALARGAKVEVNGRVVKRFKHFFAEKNDASGSELEPFAILGSADFLEIAVENGSAAELLKAKRGQPVCVGYTQSK